MWPFGMTMIFWAIPLGILIYLIIRRLRLKKEETFEDRDN
jgi:hypothetical protein